MRGTGHFKHKSIIKQKCGSKLKRVAKQTASLVTPHLHKTVMCKMIHCNNKVKQDLQSNMQNLKQMKTLKTSHNMLFLYLTSEA